MTHHIERTVLPFTAIVGQENLKRALVLNAINPNLNGVLIKGEKGTAKSTAEELFANKLGACLYRKTSRDVYDVYRISRVDFDSDVFRKCLVIDSLTRGRPPLNEIEVSERLDSDSVSLDSRLQNLLRPGTEVDFQEVTDMASGFAEKTIDDLTEGEKDLIREFLR